MQVYEVCLLFSTDQKLDLCKANPDDGEAVRGQVVISLLSRDGHGSGSDPTVVLDRLGNGNRLRGYLY